MKKSLRTGSFALALILMVLPAIAQEYASLIEYAEANGIPVGGKAQGDILEIFFNSWAPDSIGVAYDPFDTTSVWYFAEAEPLTGIYQVTVSSPHTATPLTYSKLGGPNVTGGAIRPSDGYIYAADFNGDRTNIDDNIYLFDRSGATVAFWETDGGLAGTPCSGGSVDTIVDIAIDPADPNTIYALDNKDNTVYAVDVSDTSGGSGSPSSCTISVAGSVPLSLPVGIDYDYVNDGYWVSDFNSDTVLLVANDGTFSTVIESFSASAGGGRNTGITAQLDNVDPVPVWVTDFLSANTAIVDSGTFTETVLDIPTLGQVGLIILMLLIFTAGLVRMGRA